MADGGSWWWMVKGKKWFVFPGGSAFHLANKWSFTIESLSTFCHQKLTRMQEDLYHTAIENWFFLSRRSKTHVPLGPLSLSWDAGIKQPTKQDNLFKTLMARCPANQPRSLRVSFHLPIYWERRAPRPLRLNPCCLSHRLYSDTSLLQASSRHRFCLVHLAINFPLSRFCHQLNSHEFSSSRSS